MPRAAGSRRRRARGPSPRASSSTAGQRAAPRRAGRAPCRTRRPRSRRTRGWRARPSTRSGHRRRPELASARRGPGRGSGAPIRPRTRGSTRTRAGRARSSAATPPSGGASAASTAATARVPRPAAMTRGLPNRSVRRPVIGDRANMPNVWAESTSPTVPSPCPWSLRCSGVMVMIRTITTWPATMVTSATSTAGYRKSTPSPGAGPASVRTRSADWSARRYGSGRRKTKAIANDRPMKTIVSRYAPARAGSPSASAITPAGATRLGPMTAPTVEPHTTVPIVAARRSGTAVSAAT